ncbi:MAG: biotin/lipoyl-binding protein [bacterium]|nr:biotin/lipoyl-binding protein [bacterium]
MQLHFKLDGELVAVDVARENGRWNLTVDGRSLDLDVESGGDGEWLLTAGGRRRRLVVAADGAERQVFCEGRVRRLALHDPDLEDEEAAGGGPSVTAAMPGKIVRVLVAEGDPVEVGQALIIMESMKMETDLTAAVAGTVARIAVAAEQVVGQGDLLVEIEPGE